MTWSFAPVEMTENNWRQQKMTQTDRADQELSKTFCGLKIRPFLRKLQAFTDWQFFDFYWQLK